MWLCYLQILINRGAGSALDARCVLANMSPEPIYVQNVLATLMTEEGTWSFSATDLEPQDQADVMDGLASMTNQGPLRSGSFRDLGTFENLLRKAHDSNPDWRGGDSPTGGARPHHITILVIAVYGPDELVVGAWRHFRMEETGSGWRTTPTTADTAQARSRRQRRRLHHLMRQHL